MEKKVLLKDVATLLNGRAYKQDELLDSGKYPVLRVGNFFSNRGWFYSDLELEDDKYCDNGDLLFAWSASFGPKIWDGGKVIYHYHIWKILTNPQIDKKFFYYYLENAADRIKESGHGIAMIHTTKGEMEQMELLLPDMEQQLRIASTLDKVSELIDLRKQQLAKLDDLVKSRFIELFGDPTITDKNRTYIPMTSICEIIDGDRGKNYPKQEEFYDEGYCLFLNAKNVTANGFDFTNCMFITEEKDKLLRKGKLRRGDVVLTTRGTIGNLAYYSDDVQFHNVRINSGMVILRMNHELVDEIFFIEQFRLQLAEIKEKIASGSAQPQLPISTMNNIQMLVPEISKQKDFVAFVEQTDKSKLVIQQSLEKLETLKKSLMQKYFG